MNPKVSVIIPIYNRSWAIGRSVNSVLGQSFEDFELLLVDDGSTDGTSQVLKEFKDKRIKIWKTPNRGVSRARNLAIEKAKGQWIAFIDSDDEWMPHKLQDQLDYLVKWPKIKIIHGEEIWFRKKVRVNPKKKHAKRAGHIFAKCLPLCAISPSTVMIHREVFQQIGAFDPQMIVCEDYDLWLRITPFFEVGLIQRPIVKKYGGHKDQLSAKYKAMDYFRIKAIDKVLKLNIGKENALMACEELFIKAQILLKGYYKHQRMDKYDEILGLFQETQKLYCKLQGRAAK